jgi:hypothetical protein
MSNYSELSIKELYELAKQTIHNIHKDVLTEEYKNIEDEEHQKIKIYTAINRINMYIATNILNLTFYTYDLKHLLESKKRKSIIKIIEGCEELKYQDVRNSWYEDGMRDLFYKQKEDKKYSEKLSSICILVRNNTQEAFLRIENNTPTLTKSISQASEFIATSNDNHALDAISMKIKEQFPEDELKVFFSSKMAGRIQSS